MIHSKLFQSCASVTKVFGKIPENEFNVCTDSRAWTIDSLFIALRGEKFDGFVFVERLLKEGALIVACEDIHKEKIELLANDYPDCCFILTSDTLLFTQQLAHAYIKDWLSKGHHKKVIGISGSNGKTTHKEMLFHFLKSLGPSKVICTEKNNNNHLGVPLTIFQIKEETQYAIIELGSNHPGEIKTLCDIAIPNMGVVTNIGATHLEFFGSIEKVFLEEGYLYNSVNENTGGVGAFFINMNDDYLRTLPMTKGSISFGEKDGDAHFSYFPGMVQIDWKGEKIQLFNPHIIGRHNFHNLAVTYLMAASILPSQKEVLKNLSQTFKPKDNRSMWIEYHGKKVFLDAYNANPSSMRVSLEGFIQFCEENHFDLTHVLFVLGDMNELGNNGQEYHEEIGRFLSEKGVKNVVFIGRFQDSYQRGYGQKSILASNSESFKDQSWESEFKKHDYFFFKGSRSLQLERILGIKEH
ncbi:MAG: UDP-N-acetylmuramoyl-tripeptide--D-alanyl-D-alanine ligase [Bacteriovoracaceae bacterium]